MRKTDKGSKNKYKAQKTTKIKQEVTEKGNSNADVTQRAEETELQEAELRLRIKSCREIN